MRPNEVGGYTLENHFEILAALNALWFDGHSNHADRLLVRIQKGEGVHGNVHPDFLPQGEEVLELNTQDTALVVSSLRKAVRGKWNPRAKINIGPANKMVARSILSIYDGKPNPFNPDGTSK